MSMIRKEISVAMQVQSIVCYLLSFGLLFVALKMTDDLIGISRGIIENSQNDAERSAFFGVSVKRFGLFGLSFLSSIVGVWLSVKSKSPNITKKAALFVSAGLGCFLLIETAFTFIGYSSNDWTPYTSINWMRRHWHPINSLKYRDVEPDP